MATNVSSHYTHIIASKIIKVIHNYKGIEYLISFVSTRVVCINVEG